MSKIPFALIVLRFVLGPVTVLAYTLDAEGYWYMIILTAGFLSDVFDGIIARKLKVATDELRSLDSWADTVFYLCVFLVMLMMHADFLLEYRSAIALLLILELVRHIYDKVKFNKSASYHMWSAKIWGVFLFLGSMQVLVFGEAGVFFLMALIMGIVSDIEGLAASIILSTWRADVPSAMHAYRIEKSMNVLSK